MDLSGETTGITGPFDALMKMRLATKAAAASTAVKRNQAFGLSQFKGVARPVRGPPIHDNGGSVVAVASRFLMAPGGFKDGWSRSERPLPAKWRRGAAPARRQRRGLALKRCSTRPES